MREGLKLFHVSAGSNMWFGGSFQQSTGVPQTPLHTARVLQEDKDHWDDVKVGGLGLPLPIEEGLGLRGDGGVGFLEPGLSFNPPSMPGALAADYGTSVSLWHLEH